MATVKQLLDKQKDISMVIAIEELAELQQALSKFLRKKPNIDNLCEEFADVTICLEWIKEYCNLNEEDIEKWRQYKKKRLDKRYENGEL